MNLNLWRQPLVWSAVAVRLAEGLTWCGRGLLLKHWRWVVRCLLVITAAVAVGGVLVLLYLDPGQGGLAEETLEPLDVAAIERLVVWKEERAQARAAPWTVTVHVFKP